jgi:hypothetical protein
MSMNDTQTQREARVRPSRNQNYIADDDVIPAAQPEQYAGRVASRSGAPLFEGLDIAAGVLAAAMLLGPLAANAVGWGL